MAAVVPWTELQGSQRLRVLDPMAGSGTTIVVAKALGHSAIGFDTDPLAVLLSNTWCADLDEHQVRLTAIRVCEDARAEAETLRVRDAYPTAADAETREFIRYWFDSVNRRQLTALSRQIAHVSDARVRNALWCAFSRTIIAKQASVSRAMDIPHSRPHRVDDKTDVRAVEVFLPAVERVLAAAPFKTIGSGTGSVQQADARALPLPDASIDVAITSPPYLNAIDYLRGHKFSLVWMGHGIRALRKVRTQNIGTEASLDADGKARVVTNTIGQMGPLGKLPKRQTRLLARYIIDMEAALREIHRVLVPSGRALLVIGDCWVRGVYVRNSLALAHLAEHVGLRVVEVRRRRLPPDRRYLPPPSAKNSGDRLRSRMRTEALLRLEKVA
jgi:DNA modification methylase